MSVRPEVAEEQPGGFDLAHRLQGVQGEVEVEVGRRSGGPHIGRFWHVDPGGIAGVEVAGGRVHQPDVVAGVTGVMECGQRPAVPEVDRSPLRY